MFTRLSLTGKGEGEDHPFKIYVRLQQDAWQAKVSANSYLSLSALPSNSRSITNLDTWFNISVSSVIWLYGAVNNYSVTSASIAYTGSSDTFNFNSPAWESSAYVSLDSSTNTQNTFRFFIGNFYQDGNNLVVRQSLRNNLIIRNAAIDGRAAVYPMLWGSPPV